MSLWWVYNNIQIQTLNLLLKLNNCCCKWAKYCFTLIRTSNICDYFIQACMCRCKNWKEHFKRYHQSITSPTARHGSSQRIGFRWKSTRFEEVTIREKYYY